MAQAIDHSVLDETLTGLTGAGHWYVGFSGGIDSTVLLDLVQGWRRASPGAPPLTAIHVNHHLQARAVEWQEHCAQICRRLEVPLLVEAAAVVPDRRGIEAAARDARYRLFEARLQAGDVLFLGHHLDDQVETFFLRLLRGSGVHGLAAMPGRRSLGRGTLVRPLLGLRRAQLELLAEQRGLDYIEDPSNADRGLDRNYLRHEVLPLLARRWPGYRQTVNRASEHLADVSAMLAAEVGTPATCFSAVGDPGFRVAELRGKPAGTAALALRAWLRAGGFQAPDRLALEEFLRQLGESREEARPRLQTSAYFLQRHRDAVYLVLTAGSAERPCITLRPGEHLSVPGVGEVALEPCRETGVWLAPGEQVELRWRRGGERCRPAGRDSSTSLKKLLQERQVPPWWRDRVPLFYLGDELLAVGDLWLCSSSRCGESGRPGDRCYRPCWTPIIPAGFD